MDDWGIRLQEALRKRHVPKLYALAVEIGVDQSALSRWLKGLPISLPNAVALCNALDISLDWLVTGRGTMESHRAAPPDPVDFAALAFFDTLSAKEAAAVRQALRTLSDAADRRRAAAES